ncbi:MAG: hypothetical protein KUG77_00245 [Nannocystaceae bacterium]|nr:hypothetical protein [Nannocystaceae bacterium]
MTSPDELTKDSIEDVLAAAEALLHDPVAAPRFAIPCVRRAWAIKLEEAADLPAALLQHDGVQKAQRVRFADTWQRFEEDGRTLTREELLEQVRVLRRASAPANRRMLYAAWALMAAALLGILMLRMYSGSVATTQGSSVGAWRVEVFAIKEFRGPSAVFRAADADFSWKGPPHETMPKDKFATRLTTCLELDAPTRVDFVLVANDGARLFIDDKKAINAWNVSGKARTVTRQLPAGTHHIVLEHHDKRGTASINLTASFNGGLPGPIPPALLRYSSNPEEC